MTKVERMYRSLACRIANGLSKLQGLVERLEYAPGDRKLRQQILSQVHKVDPLLEKLLTNRCHVCGCTEDDCSQCVEKTGEPCHWVAQDLCSACEAEA